MNCPGGKTDGSPLVRQPTGTSPLTITIVRAVAAVKNEDPQSLEPLGSVIDPEALETILDKPDSAAHVTFNYADHRVVVTGDAVEVY
ncbi:HalOD1 output domain-containing protein [Haloarcula sediminis]|uniref:HalOD1 output domain-containing protein n=1 Tax=Haloarcula sediminis TaxID=3111777 RepID=UPI002D765C1E|nr:HalOD1 output domain-containing protein [Haloarcula sp. CK38]